MSWFSDFERGFAGARAAAVRPRPPVGHIKGRIETRGRSAPKIIVPPSPLQFGYFYDRKKKKVYERDPLLYSTALHIVLFGLNGAGKQTRILTPVYMGSRGRSLFVVETKGTAALQCGDERLRYGKRWIICPFPVLGLKSDGWNPLLFIDADSPHCLGDARALARAMIDIEAGTGQHWSESATGLVAAVIIWEVIKARREKRKPSLFNVRMMLTEPDKWGIGKDGKPTEKLVAGLRFTAQQMVEQGGPIIKSLVGRFLRPDGKDELASIQSTASTQTEFLLNSFIADDLSKGDKVDLTRLSQEPISVFVVCAASDLPEFRRWIRMVLSFAIRAHLTRPPKINTLFVIDEYRATVGKLELIKENWALVREHGIQFLIATQSALHLQALHGEEWQDFLGQSGLFATIGPTGDDYTASFLSKRCGNTVELQAGFNSGMTVNNGKNPSSGTTAAPGGPSSQTGLGLSLGGSTSGTYTVQQVERAAVRPEELMSLLPGEGRLWLQGLGTKSFPFFAPNYWKRSDPWVARVKPNPMYRS
jgi:type IV secretory pathway TraG/TraD family ATPase VirD4